MKTDNELIAEFMGIRHRKQYGIMGDTEWTEVEVTYRTSIAEWQSAKWDKSWDWLMPVVERIQSIGYHTSMYHDCDKLTYTYRNEMRIVNSDESKIRYRELSNGETMIQCVYTAVVEFVKWHNQLT
jgi:hypothetical protein